MDEPWKARNPERRLREQDFKTAAERVGCDVAAIKAVWDVEAAGEHFRSDGSVIWRFEPHHFPRDLWPRIGFSVRSGEAPWRASLRLSSEPMFQRAAKIDADAAMRASSWGAPQQLSAFIDLVESWGIASALRSHDWEAFARRYNGSGRVGEYARLMEAAYRRHSDGNRTPVVLRVGARGAAVRKLQEALGVDVDGAFGPQTLAAVEAFQKDAGLVVDGVVGAKTWAALDRHAVAHGSQVKPPAQDSVTDWLERELGRWGGIVSAAGAAGATVSDTLSDLPVPVIGALAAAALIGAAMWWHKRSEVS